MRQTTAVKVFAEVLKVGSFKVEIYGFRNATSQGRCFRLASAAIQTGCIEMSDTRGLGWGLDLSPTRYSRQQGAL